MTRFVENQTPCKVHLIKENKLMKHTIKLIC